MSNDQRSGGFDCGCNNFGYGGGSKSSIGAILVLFILLVIIASAFCSY
ncbi:hypothetical protein J45TS6_23520 [Paenibacillus sp. J45TS6]|nr:sporulation protein YjcZ [Paenibacillus sp. J45TS6]GIP43893.1 hypothetical protein J45TS6_23520 [Paenibacillus sp. J45TS6]